MSAIKSLACAGLAFAAATSAEAAVTLQYSGSNDAAYELAGGYLNSTLGLPLVSGTALPPLERAVGETRIGRTGERRVGFHVPNGITGLPVPAGTGVTQALTNASPIGLSDAAWVNGAPVAFSISRSGTTVTYTVGSNSWSSTASYFGDIDAFQFRIRSQAGRTNSLGLIELVYRDAVTANQLLPTVTAADGQVAIRLYSGVRGDFTLSGKYNFAWAGAAPTGSQLASQLKLLDLPGATVPEPATWAMMILGFGMVGAAMRRRQALAC